MYFVKKSSLYCLLFFTSIGYSQKVKVNKLSNKVFESYNETSPFGVIEDNEKPDKGELIATIKIIDGGFTIDCSWNKILNRAKQESRKLGGNCLFIIEHKYPDKLSTCHRLYADIYTIHNPSKYESVIKWQPDRKLEKGDFKADTAKKPFIAATYSYFEYYIEKLPFSKKVKISVSTYFKKELSYFKDNKSEEMILSHEQRHFDITEIYSRLFFEELTKLSSYQDLQRNANQIMEKYHKILSDKQDEYDSEVYKDWSIQEKWDAWVFEKLTETNHLIQKTKEFKN